MCRWYDGQLHTHKRPHSNTTRSGHDACFVNDRDAWLVNNCDAWLLNDCYGRNRVTFHRLYCCYG